MLDETMMSLQNSQQEWEKLKAQTGAYRANCKAILTSQLRLLDDMAADGEGNAADILAQSDMAPAVSVNENRHSRPAPTKVGRMAAKKMPRNPNNTCFMNMLSFRYDIC